MPGPCTHLPNVLLARLEVSRLSVFHRAHAAHAGEDGAQVTIAKTFHAAFTPDYNMPHKMEIAFGCYVTSRGFCHPVVSVASFRSVIRKQTRKLLILPLISCDAITLRINNVSKRCHMSTLFF